MTNKTTGNNDDKSTHRLRLLYMLGFYLVYKLSDFVVLAIVILQGLTSTFGSGPNEKVTEFGRSLAVYISQIVRFLSFADEKKPYPFSDWP